MTKLYVLGAIVTLIHVMQEDNKTMEGNIPFFELLVQALPVAAVWPFYWFCKYF